MNIGVYFGVFITESFQQLYWMSHENNLHLNFTLAIFMLYLVHLKRKIKLCLVSLAKFSLQNVKEKLIKKWSTFIIQRCIGISEADGWRFRVEIDQWDENGSSISVNVMGNLVGCIGWQGTETLHFFNC